MQSARQPLLLGVAVSHQGGHGQGSQYDLGAERRPEHGAGVTLGRHGAGKVVLRAAPAGTGIIAGGPMRAVFESVGMQDVVAKSVGSSNPYNMVRATFDALSREASPRSVALAAAK